MNNSDFMNRIKVDKKDLIPMDSSEKCLWVMNIANNAINLGQSMAERGQDTSDYLNYYYSISHSLSELEYSLRKGDIDEKVFEQKCEEVYERYNIDFDVFRQNDKDLEKSRLTNNKIKQYLDENYYRFEYDENNTRIKTDLENTSEKFDSDLSYNLTKQVEEYHKKQAQKTKEHPVKDTKDNIGQEL